MDQFCRACLECQWYLDHLPPRAPLQPLEIVSRPFNKIALDIISPLPKSATGYQFALVIMDYVTQYPDVIPIRTVTAPKVVEELIR